MVILEYIQGSACVYARLQPFATHRVAMEQVVMPLMCVGVVQGTQENYARKVPVI